MDIKITVEAPELAAAINNLAAALKENGVPAAKTAPVPTATQKATPAQTSPVPTTDTPPAVPTAAAVPPTTPATIPTAPPPQYTHEQIMKAGAALIDNGKIAELQNLIKSFGVVKVMDLKQEQLGTFATELRKPGAKI